MEPNVTTWAIGRPLFSSESSAACGFAGKRLLNEKLTSPPIRARDCSRIDVCTLLANESMATSAATPSEIDDMYNSNRRRAVRLSRHAREER